MPSETQTATILRLAGAMESLTRAVENIGREVHEQDRRHIEMTTQLSGLTAAFQSHQCQFEGMTKLVRDGNGQPPLLSRVSVIETTLQAISVTVKDMAERYNSVVTAKALTRGQIIAGIISMVVTSLMSLGAILAQLLKG